MHKQRTDGHKPHALPVAHANGATVNSRLASVLLFLFPVLFVGCSPDPPPRPDIVFVVLDTVRADHLSSWGYPQKTSPNLDNLLKGATQYVHAQASSSWTLPSHASMFTGLHPFQHGAHAHAYVNEQGELRVHEPPLADEIDTLAERLQSVGYATGAFVANVAYLRPSYNLQQGFDFWELPDKPGTPGLEIIEQAKKWLAQPHEKPLFLFINLIDAHRPYNLTQVDTLYGDAVSTDTTLLDQLRDQVLPGKSDADPELAAEVTKQYDTGIANADRALGMLLDTLKAQDRFDAAMIVVTSDHGEYLGEHRLVEHSKGVHESVLWVPLAIKWPHQKQPEVHTERVTIGQLYATVMETLGLAPNPEAMPAIPAKAPQSLPVLAELYYSRNWDLESPEWGWRFRSIHSVLYQDDWKFIHSTDGEHEMYNLKADPKESQNLYPENTKKTGGLLKTLGDIKKLDVEPPKTGYAPQEMTPQEEEHMRTLGYLQ